VTGLTLLEHLIPAAGSHGLIRGVRTGSLAEEHGLLPGERLLSINGHALRDQIDYRFYQAEDAVVLEVGGRDDDARVRLVRVLKHPDEDLGLDFGDSLTFDGITECNNHCPFCFVTQLPRGMRSTLHIKDDDYRYSFLYGGFVTLTNLSEADWQRIEEQHLSPLYLSVHSTDPELRARLLGNRRAPPILEQIDRLGAIGIQVHTQLVLCPGINDGADLDRSLADLMARYPQVQTISAVPVGLTRIRTERTAAARNPLRRFRPDEAAAIVERLQPYQEANRRALGSRVVFASDEFYLLAGHPVPPASHYEGYPQFSNGIGMVRVLLDDFRALRRRLPAALDRPRHLTMACATLIHPILRELVADLNTIANLRVDLHVVHNTLFGDEVTVAGLISGRDLLETLGSVAPGDTVVLPRVMFDDGGTLLIDDVTLEQVCATLDRPVVLVDSIKELRDVLLRPDAKPQSMARYDP
jgi:putative radical SAM enzyme (TIGR03279 family)